jgi:cell wall-associated NlpC family hydrolase
MKTTILILAAMQYLNTPYKWGGQNYLGLDCSGFVLKVLSDVGYFLTDRTAQGLYDHCLKVGTSSEEGLCDSLLFFGKPDKITHVAISLGVVDDSWWMIEAGGAGRNSLTLSPEELAQRDARVRLKPVASRRDLVASISIPYKNRAN